MGVHVFIIDKFYTFIFDSTKTFQKKISINKKTSNYTLHIFLKTKVHIRILHYISDIQVTTTGIIYIYIYIYKNLKLDTKLIPNKLIEN